jgi:hypothetical protein
MLAGLLCDHTLKYAFFLSFSLAAKGAELWFDTSSVNAAIVNTYKSACDRHFEIHASDRKGKLHNGSNDQSWGPSGVYRASPISLAKAVKNSAELEGMHNSHLRYLPLSLEPILVIVKAALYVIVCPTLECCVN